MSFHSVYTADPLLWSPSNANHRILIIKPQDRHTHTWSWSKIWNLSNSFPCGPCCEYIAGHNYCCILRLHYYIHFTDAFVQKVHSSSVRARAKCHKKYMEVRPSQITCACAKNPKHFTISCRIYTYHKVTAGIWMYADHAKHLLYHSIIFLNVHNEIFIPCLHFSLTATLNTCGAGASESIYVGINGGPRVMSLVTQQSWQKVTPFASPE